MNGFEVRHVCILQGGKWQDHYRDGLRRRLLYFVLQRSRVVRRYEAVVVRQIPDEAPKPNRFWDCKSPGPTTLFPSTMSGTSRNCSSNSISNPLDANQRLLKTMSLQTEGEHEGSSISGAIERKSWISSINNSLTASILPQNQQS